MAHQNGTCVTMAHLAHIVLQTDDAVILFLGWWLISWLHIILIVVSCKVRVLTNSGVVADIGWALNANSVVRQVCRHEDALDAAGQHCKPQETEESFLCTDLSVC